MSTPYDFLDQNIVSSCLIQVKDSDSFFVPDLLQHTGFAFDGNHYTAGVQDIAGSPPGPVQASWFTEAQSIFRGPLQTFPTAGLALLSPAALSIFDESGAPLTLWMGFILADGFALGNNYDSTVEAIGFKPSSVQYANGIVSVTLKPDAGSTNQSTVTIHMDFSGDRVYLDTAVAPAV